MSTKHQNMYSLNKCLVIFHLNNYFINKSKLNTISLKLTKRLFNSTKNDLNFKQFINCYKNSINLSTNGHKIRYLSTNESLKTLKTSDLKPKSESTGQTSPSVETAGASEPRKRVVKPIGIVGIHEWKVEPQRNVKEWLPIYHFPYISYVRTFQRMKLWITVMTGCCIPLTFGLYTIGSAALESCYYYSVLSVFSLLMMNLFGQVFRRFVGRVYISDNQSFARLSHLSFFGNRIDIDIEAKDVLPLVDTNVRLNDWFCRIERYSAETSLYMSLKFGGIVNREGFDKVFGEGVSKLCDK